MSSSAYWFIKLMICFVFLCTFVQISNTQPLLTDEDDDQTPVDNALLNNYVAGFDRFVSSNPHRFNILDNFNTHRQQHSFYPNQPYNPDNVQLAKRIIMLPRVGRRSIRSTFDE